MGELVIFVHWCALYGAAQPRLQKWVHAEERREICWHASKL